MNLSLNLFLPLAASEYSIGSEELSLTENKVFVTFN